MGKIKQSYIKKGEILRSVNSCIMIGSAYDNHVSYIISSINAGLTKKAIFHNLKSIDPALHNCSIYGFYSFCSKTLNIKTKRTLKPFPKLTTAAKNIILSLYKSGFDKKYIQTIIEDFIGDNITINSIANVMRGYNEMLPGYLGHDLELSRKVLRSRAKESREIYELFKLGHSSKDINKVYSPARVAIVEKSILTVKTLKMVKK